VSAAEWLVATVSDDLLKQIYMNLLHIHFSISFMMRQQQFAVGGNSLFKQALREVKSEMGIEN